MMNVSEVVCTELQNAPVVDTAQVADKDGAPAEELFAVLLAALSGGLFASQGDASVVVPGGEHATQSDVSVASDAAVECDVTAGGVSVADGGAAVPRTAVPSVVQASSEEGAARVPEGEARGSPTQGTSGVTVQSSGETAPLEPTRAAAEGSTGGRTLVSLQPPGESAPAINGTPGDQIVVAAQGDRSGSATGAVIRSVPGMPAGEPRVSVLAEAAQEIEPGAQPVLSGGSSPVQSAAAPARGALELGGEDSAARGTHHEAESGGSNPPAGGSADRIFLETLAHAQDGRARGALNVTSNDASPVGNSGEARFAESIVEQTVRSVVLSARGGSSELRVRLWPEHLGELHLRLVFKDNVLTLDVNTQSSAVKSVIESNLSQLRHALQHNGVDVGKVSVMVDPDLASGGRFSRQTPVFQPFDDRWLRSYSGQQPEQEPSVAEWFRGARKRHLLCRIDLVA